MPRGIYERSAEYKKEVSERNKKLGIRPKKRWVAYGKDHPLWTGDCVNYRALHYWVARHLGKATKCAKCGKIGKGKKIHWANKSHKYKRLPDWIPLCASCHKIYDLTYKKNGNLFRR